MPQDTEHMPSHPCFGEGVHKTVGRVHLPVAARDYARRRYASEPVAKEALSPKAALAWLAEQMELGFSIAVVGVTGPGDPMASPQATLETLGLVRDAYPDMALCLTTLGMGAADAAEDLARLGVDHVTLLVDAVAPQVVEQLYAWIRPATHTLPLRQGAEILVQEQERAVVALKAAGIVVKINTTVYPGLNAEHVEYVAERMAELGADIMRLTPCPAPAAGEGEQDSPPGPCAPSAELMAELRLRVEAHLPLMPEREGCGEDTVGTAPIGPKPGGLIPKPTPERPNVAVCSSEGLDVDLHLGQARQFLVYGPSKSGDGLVVLLESRRAPEPGIGPARWQATAEILKDCFTLLAAAAGETPKTVLADMSLPVLITEASVEGAVDALFGGNKKCGKERAKNRG